MPSNPQDTPKPKIGDLRVDATFLVAFIVDLAEGETRGMLTERNGFTEVIAEITAAQPQWGDKAGVTASDFAEFQSANDVVTQIRELLPAARKLVEMLEETESKYEDQRQRFVYTLATNVERRAKARDDGGSLLAKYQKTREYRSALARKSLKTRRRNAEQAADAAEAPPAAPPAQPTPPPA